MLYTPKGLKDPVEPKEIPRFTWDDNFFLPVCLYWKKNSSYCHNIVLRIFMFEIEFNSG